MIFSQRRNGTARREQALWRSHFWLCVVPANLFEPGLVQMFLDSGPKNLLASLCLSSWKAQTKN